MKRLLLSVILVIPGLLPSFAMERLQLEGFKDITENVNSHKITKADFIILGLDFNQADCEYFRYCYKPISLTLDNLVNFSISFSGNSENHSSRRREFFENEFKLNVSFDMQLCPNLNAKPLRICFIPVKFSNSQTTFEGRINKYSYQMNSAYSDNIYRLLLPEIKFGPYSPDKVDYKKGIEAVCDYFSKYNNIPMVLKPYAQNLIKFKSESLNENSLNSVAYKLDEDGNKGDEFSSNISFSYDIYAVLNSLTFADGTSQNFNTMQIDEKEWVSQNKQYDTVYPWEGKGTSDSPFLIKNVNDLLALTTAYKHIDAGYYFRQEADIEIKNTDFWGRPQENLLLYHYEKPFKGHYDGNGKTISGLRILTAEKELPTLPKAFYNDCHGLFHRVRNAEFKNLTLNCEIDIGDNKKAGAIAGEAVNATFTNVTLNAKVKGAESIGGLIGEGINIAFNDVTGDSNDVAGKKFVGGILGKGEKITANNLNLKNSSVKGDEYVGGAFGKIEKHSNIRNLKADINVTGKKICGGAAGRIGEYSSGNNIFVSGNVSGEATVGGIFGKIWGNNKKEEKQDAYSCFVSKANLTASKGTAGGIVATIAENASLTDCVNHGTVIGMFAGGIVSLVGVEGTTWGVTAVARCENHGAVKSTAEIKCYTGGGIACNLKMQNSIKDCYNDANVEAREWCGGIVGNNDKGYIQNCYAIGEFKTESYDSKVGGIAGMFFAPTGPVGSNQYATIKNCFITGDTKFKFKGKPSTDKNETHKCCGEEPKYKESFSNLQYFASASDIKLDSSWNADVWEIKAGAYPKLKMAHGLSNE